MSILLERSRPTGRVWHRARVQPFRNPDHLGAAQETLQSPFHLPLFLYELWWFHRSWMCGWLLGITAVSSLYCSGPRTNTLLLAVNILVRRAQFWCIVTSTQRYYFYMAVFGRWNHFFCKRAVFIDFHFVGSVRAWYVLHRRRSYSTIASLVF